SFCAQPNCTDGDGPEGLTQGIDGNFYGATTGGGNNSCSSGVYCCGTIFSMTPNGVLTTLYSFCSQANCADGYDPQAGLVQGTDGNFYGTAGVGGGVTCFDTNGCGTIFSITSSGALTVLY